MQSERLPDGRYATTPFYMGPINPNFMPCDEHSWEPSGPVQAILEGAIQFETCRVCHWTRAIYSEAPKS